MFGGSLFLLSEWARPSHAELELYQQVATAAAAAFGMKCDTHGAEDVERQR